MFVDPTTRAWIRNRSDELAAADGCTFDVDRASFTVWWIERFCKLYQGEQAGEPMVLRGCHQCFAVPNIPQEWNDEAIALYRERAKKHNKCVKAGHAVDWQYDCVMRMFGWERYSTKWARKIRRFTEASIWVAKKNKKSPTLAAIGLFLFCGDGEPGQCVFIAAKDGTQAREVAGKHIVEMYYKSEELQTECKLNQGTLQLTHFTSRSILRPLSSSNKKTQENKEGLNGSVIIDETHVVDEEFVGILKGAGISRSEPYRIEVSTSGNNPDGYGKKRFDLAQRVLAGTEKRPELFVAIYAAPQMLSDEDLAADPLKYARMANPAMGHTVDPEEFLRDYHNSKGTLTEFLLFKMYRLNIWQRAANPWIRPDHWAKCYRPFTLEDMRGQPCCAGLDLAKVWDLTALVLVWPWTIDGDRQGFRIWPFFFMPADTARERNDKFPFLQMAKEGHCVLTPGGSCDYGFVRKQFRECAEMFNIRELNYDPWQANDTTQTMEQGTVVDGIEIEAGTGIPRMLFKQSLYNFTGPSNEFEKQIVDGTLQHAGNPIMNWQVGHVTVHVDHNRNKRPVKQKQGDYKSIDGPVATIMGLSGCTRLSASGEMHGGNLIAVI